MSELFLILKNRGRKLGRILFPAGFLKPPQINLNLASREKKEEDRDDNAEKFCIFKTVAKRRFFCGHFQFPILLAFFRGFFPLRKCHSSLHKTWEKFKS